MKLYTQAANMSHLAIGSINQSDWEALSEVCTAAIVFAMRDKEKDYPVNSDDPLIVDLRSLLA